MNSSAVAEGSLQGRDRTHKKNSLQLRHDPGALWGWRGRGDGGHGGHGGRIQGSGTQQGCSRKRLWVEELWCLVRGLLGCLLGRRWKPTCSHRRLLLLLLWSRQTVGALNWLRSQSCAIMHHWTEDRDSRTHGTLRGGQILVKQREAIIPIHDVHCLQGEPKPSDWKLPRKAFSLFLELV